VERATFIVRFFAKPARVCQYDFVTARDGAHFMT